jgi:hypothetical protein
MTDRKDALTELLAKVEAGKWCTKLALKALPESHVNDSHEWIDPIGWASRALHNGSLDAAKALHEAVLHERVIKREDWSLRYGGTVELRDHGKVIGRGGNTDDNPARAWLIAILKALIAGEDTNANDKGE